MLYGFIDESGTPGVANREVDFLAVSLVICDSLEKVEKIQEAMARHRERNGLPPDYEFHCSSNSVKQQEKFVELIANFDFRFITVSIKKGNFKKTATYEKLAQKLLEKIRQLDKEIKINMDVNPSMYKVLDRETRRERPRKIWVKEAKSKTLDLLQVVDYVVNISVKELKGKKNGERWCPKIKKKRIT